MMRGRPLLVAVVFAAFVVGVLVASIIGSAPGGHRPGTLEWTIQLVILAGAVLLIAGRVRRKR